MTDKTKHIPPSAYKRTLVQPFIMVAPTVNPMNPEENIPASVFVNTIMKKIIQHRKIIIHTFSDIA
jgi:hypothetical protein